MKKINCILLIDNDDINNLLNSVLIQEYEICDDVKVLDNGEEGLEYLKNSTPELIILDYQVHTMSGKDFILQLRSLETIKERKSTVIVLSAHLPENVKEELSSLGITFFNKPLTKEKSGCYIKRAGSNIKELIIGRLNSWLKYMLAPAVRSLIISINRCMAEDCKMKGLIESTL